MICDWNGPYLVYGRIYRVFKTDPEPEPCSTTRYSSVLQIQRNILLQSPKNGYNLAARARIMLSLWPHPGTGPVHQPSLRPSDVAQSDDISEGETPYFG
jgi:hypothetical protein